MSACGVGRAQAPTLKQEPTYGNDSLESLPIGIPPTLGGGGCQNLYDRWGNYVRTDRLYDIIRLRKHGRVPFSGCNPYRFQAVLATDPDRIIILNCLPHTVYTAPAPTPPASNAVFMPENQFGGSL